MKYVMYVIYLILYLTLIIGGCGYAVFVLGHSGWWFLLAVLFASAGYSPESFSIQKRS